MNSTTCSFKNGTYYLESDEEIYPFVLEEDIDYQFRFVDVQYSGSGLRCPKNIDKRNKRLQNF